ncbi:MAG: hypothetical protein WKF87_06695 [Chryseolinea sp.]
MIVNLYQVDLKCFCAIPEDMIGYTLPDRIFSAGAYNSRGYLASGYHSFRMKWTEDEMEAFADYIYNYNDLKLIGITKIEN